MKLFFSEVNNLNTPRGESELVPLNTDYAFEVCGRFAEGLLLNEKVNIPINGPALPLVVLNRWFGHKELTTLINEGTIKFSFYPGTFSYITEANKRALSLDTDTGLNWIKGNEKGWDNIHDAVRVALEEQLNYSSGKARRFSRRVAKQTKDFSSEEIYEEVKDTAYKNASNLISEINFQEVDKLKSFSRGENQTEIRQLLNISSAYLEFMLSSLLDCTDIYGNETTWKVINDLYKKASPQTNLETTADKLNRILKFERVPDIITLMKRDWDIAKIIEIRKDPHIEEFRNWLKNEVPNSSDVEIVRSYYETFKEKTSEYLPVKTMRVGIPVALSLLGPVGSAISSLFSVVDGFLGDKLINGWNPHVFIEEHFKYSNKDINNDDN